MNLFCLPYVGGSAAIFAPWARKLQATIKVVPMELAGHGRRLAEPFHDSIAAAVADMLAVIGPSARSAPYAIYGHSMGTVIAYELIKAIAAAGLPPPHTLFISGRKPPHLCGAPRNFHLLGDAMLLAEIKKLGGTPEEFFKMKDLVKAFLPIIRSDYRMLELYRPALPIHVTAADIVFFHSSGDALVSGPDVNEWRRYTGGSFTRKDFEGGHFFINQQHQEICRVIEGTLCGERYKDVAA